MSRHRLLIIDGYSLLFRAFYSTRYMSTTDGRPTNALYGFIGMIFALIERERPNAIVLALDTEAKTFRHAEYAEYKGKRKEVEPELVVQFPWAREILDALGIPTISVVGFEADDVVGTISLKAESMGYDTYIVTGDNDQLQLVDDFVRVITTKVGVTEVNVYDIEKVTEKFGVPPTVVPDWKAIVGDPSDNIPGVPGIGEKGATYLLQKWPSVESILENLNEVDEKYRKKIEPVIDQMKLSKWLATIVRDVPLEYDFQPFQISPQQMQIAKEKLEAFEFKAHLRRLPNVLGRYVEGADVEQIEESQAEVKLEALQVELTEIRQLPELQAVLNDLPYALFFESDTSQMSMFDTAETTGYIAQENRVFKVSESIAVDLFASNPNRAIGHDLKSLYKKFPTTHTPPGFDSMLAAYVLNPSRATIALRDQVQAYLDIAMPEDPQTMAAALWHLAPAMRKRLQLENQEKVLDAIELPLVPILAEMEHIGIRVDPQCLRDFSKTLEVSIEQLQAKIYEQAGCTFNIGSPKQLGEVLFEKLGIPTESKTKTGYGTGAEVLQNLVLSYPIAADVLNWRELSKLKSTYADSLPRMIREDGRIHTTYAQAVAATGRLSSVDPNLQNIPIKTELGREIRKAFISDPGYFLASFDYSQIELRLLAHMCGDPELVKAFQEHQDIHTATAALMFGISNADVTKEQRGYAKTLNFAVLYGVSGFGLANQLGGGFSVGEANALREQYFSRFPSVKGFTDDMIKDAKSKGFTTTLFGRRRYFPDIHAQNRAERSASERQAMNAPIQGSAADMIKLAMIEVRKCLGGSQTKMLLQVHDELVFEMHQSERSLVEPIRTAMENALPLNVPVVVDSKFGQNWNVMGPLDQVGTN